MTFQQDANTTYVNGQPVAKSDVRALWAAVDGVVANTAKSFHTRADAVSAGQAALPSDLGMILVDEGDYYTVRGPNQTDDDPLFATAPRWGVRDRIPTQAVMDALASNIASRRLAWIWGTNFSGVTFPTGTSTVIQRQTTSFSIWALDGSPPDPVDPIIHQQDAIGQWWVRVWSSAAAAQDLTNLTNELNTGRVFTLGAAADPSGGSIPDAVNRVQTVHFASGSYRWWRNVTAPVDGEETETLKRDADDRWWSLIRDRDLLDEITNRESAISAMEASLDILDERQDSLSAGINDVWAGAASALGNFTTDALSPRAAEIEIDDLFYIGRATDRDGVEIYPSDTGILPAPVLYEAYVDGVSLVMADRDYYVGSWTPESQSQDQGMPGDKWIHPLGGLARANPDVRYLTLWGSSSAERSGAAFMQMCSEFGVAGFAEGKGSEQYQQIFARLGSRPLRVTFPDDEIPASGFALITVTNANGSNNYNSIKAFSGIVAGVSGSVSYTAGALRFTRSTAGDPVTLSGEVEIIPDLVSISRNAPTVLWAGKNNLTQGVSGVEVAAATDDAVAWLAPITKRVLVLGHFHNTNLASGSAISEQTDICNALHRDYYGDQYIDIIDWLVSDEPWDYLNLTPTADDLTQMALRNLPPSLSANNGHLSNEAYAAFVMLQVKPRLMSLWGYRE